MGIFSTCKLSGVFPLTLWCVACGGGAGGSAPDSGTIPAEGGSAPASLPHDGAPGSTSEGGVPGSSDDAGSTHDTGSTHDATAGDAALSDLMGTAADASAAPWDGSLSSLIDHCAIARDVFYVDSLGPDSLGGIPLGELTYTNLDTTWSGTASATSIYVSLTSSPLVNGGGVLQITTTPAIPIVPGTYPEPLNHSVPRPYLDLTVGDVSLTADGTSSGSFVVKELLEEDGGTGLATIAVGFDIVVPSLNGSQYVGCTRYTEDPPFPSTPDAGDAGSTILDGVSGAALFFPCADAGTELYTERSASYPGVPGVTLLDESNASFYAGVNGPDVAINGMSRASTWQVAATPLSDGGTPTVGEYAVVSNPTSTTFQVSTTPVQGCNEPTGTYGIVNFVTDPTNPNIVTKAGIWFDLQCVGTGSLRGCVAYGL